MRSEDYHRGYWEDGVGSNYVNYGNDPGWAPTVAAMRAAMGPGAGRWLEVGCAKGWFVHEARRAGVDCQGVDISDYAISQAPPAARPHVYRGNVAYGTIYRDATFDAVCSWEFLEHVPAEELDRVLDEMQRVLAPGGWLWHRIGIDVTGDPRFAGVDHGQHNDATHVLEMPDAWWRDLFAGRGWARQVAAEGALDAVFAGRDWAGRFFVYRSPG